MQQVHPIYLRERMRSYTAGQVIELTYIIFPWPLKRPLGKFAGRIFDGIAFEELLTTIRANCPAP